MPNHRNLPMVSIEGERPFNISNIEWIEELPPIRRWSWRWIKTVVLRAPDKRWKVIFKQPDSLLARKIRPIFLIEENKLWLDKQIASHNTICDLVVHREAQGAIYGGQK